MVTENTGSKSKFEGFLKFAILIAAIILFFLIVHYNNYRDQSPLPDEALCGSCHSMKANSLTWQVTSHNKIGCSKCHNSISITKVFLKELTGTYHKPIQKHAPVSNQQCINCHNTNRTITGPGDLIIPHNLHLEKQIDCTRCHSNVTHGKVAQEVLDSKNKNPERVTLKDVKELTVVGNRVAMKDCMICHNGSKASSECSACHSEKPIPTSHNQEFMQFAHNDDALANMSACLNCHEYDVKKQAKNTSLSGFNHLVTAARNNDFCQKCHSQRPITHSSQFLIKHPREVKSNNSCLVCHDQKPNQLEASPAAANVYCNTCHNNDSVHPANWTTKHPLDLKTKDSNSCFDCHNANSCNNCHTKKGINK